MILFMLTLPLLVKIRNQITEDREEYGMYVGFQDVWATGATMEWMVTQNRGV